MFSAAAWENGVISFLIVGAEPTNRHPLVSAAAARIGIEPGLFCALWKATLQLAGLSPDRIVLLPYALGSVPIGVGILRVEKGGTGKFPTSRWTFS